MRLACFKTVAAVAIGLSVSQVAVAQDPITLTFATLATPGSPTTTNIYRPWARDVETRSGGTLKINFAEGYALANFSNALDRLTNDVIQITNIVPSSFGGRFPLAEVGNLPFIAANARTAGGALWRLYASGMLKEELEEFAPFAIYTFGNSGIHLTKTPQASLETLRGLRITVASKIQGQTISSLGGAPLVMTPQDVYEGLNRGLSDGIITSWNTFGIWKYAEVTSYHVDSQFGTAVGMISMTRKKFNALPEPARRALESSAGEALSRAAGAHADARNVSEREVVAGKPGHTIVQMSPAQQVAWREKTAAINKEWAAGRPRGAEILGAYEKHVADVQAEK